MEKIKIKLLRETSKAPVYSSGTAAGADIFADIEKEIEIKAKETVFIPSGFAVEIPSGFAGFVYPRSGLSSKRGLAPANKVGVIDSDYRGEVTVALHNHGTQTQVITPGERIAQLVIMPCVFANFIESEYLDETQRGDGGFGSTGKK